MASRTSIGWTSTTRTLSSFEVLREEGTSESAHNHLTIDAQTPAGDKVLAHTALLIVARRRPQATVGRRAGTPQRRAGSSSTTARTRARTSTRRAQSARGTQHVAVGWVSLQPSWLHALPAPRAVDIFPPLLLPPTRSVLSPSLPTSFSITSHLPTATPSSSRGRRLLGPSLRPVQPSRRFTFSCSATSTHY